MQEIQFDYYRGMEAEQYTFYRIPKILFTAECFQSLSCEAKVLYGLLLDRMSLSVRNHWFDEENRVYIIFTVEEIAALMNCGTQKAVKLLKELDGDKGIGLIEKKRLGLGKPNVIYVKNFIIQQTGDKKEEEQQGEETAPSQNGENHNSRMVIFTNQEVASSYQNEKNQGSGVEKTGNQDLSKSSFQNDENHHSRMVKIEIPEFPKSPSNKTELNKTDGIETEKSETEYDHTDFNETETGMFLPIYPNPISSNLSIPVIVSDGMEKMEAYRTMIREQISYECFQDSGNSQIEEVDELIELMVEVMLMPDVSQIRIGGVEKPTAIVKNRFMKLNQMHIEYILTCLNANTTKVGNIKSYLLTTLYNASLTMSNYYMAEVNHDLYGGKT